MSKVIVLGAKGRFGRAAVDAFVDAGWGVTELARAWPENASLNTQRVAVDVSDSAALTKVCRGQDVIVNAINPPYPAWKDEVPKITSSVLAAATANGATVMIPGNVYNFGRNMPPILTESTPLQPTSEKGKIRVRMEEVYEKSGVRTIILRGGDFLEAAKTGNWFDTYIAAKVWQGKLTYPGPRDVEHAWAYLPDMARALVGLAERRQQFDPFETFGFAGFGLDGNALISEVEAATGQRMRVRSMPWRVLGFMRLFSPQVREVLEMRYLWDVPHRIDGSKLASVIPAFRQTPPERAIASCLSPHAPASG